MAHLVQVAVAPNLAIHKGAGQNASEGVELGPLAHAAPLQAHQLAGGGIRHVDHGQAAAGQPHGGPALSVIHDAQCELAVVVVDLLCARVSVEVNGEKVPAMGLQRHSMEFRPLSVGRVMFRRPMVGLTDPARMWGSVWKLMPMPLAYITRRVPLLHSWSGAGTRSLFCFISLLNRQNKLWDQGASAALTHTDQDLLYLRIPVVLSEGYTLRTKLRSPTYRLPSIPAASATGASSLLPSARPLQLGQEMLRRRPLPMMLEMTGYLFQGKKTEALQCLVPFAHTY
ncbi:hypothetical protein JZ751_007088 [Albula glossodonta]|uniref:Uncharacterized protein n=1 Tax=Albula glossodonta TaxID=121402 RepID=A0A8T2P671_9TELE|nr:hypothetical protein JZ751_007088 [Albula glossodonta]